MKIFKFIKYIPLIIINYFLLFFLIYIISGYLLLRGITPDLKLINTFQVNFYLWCLVGAGNLHFYKSDVQKSERRTQSLLIC